MDNKPNGFLVHLDCLLDTRLSTIAQVDAEAAAKVFESKDYFEREHDRFEFLGIDQARYDELWKNRELYTLQGALRTKATDVLNKIMLDLEAQDSTTPNFSDPHVVVNIFPYQGFSDEETDQLRLAVAAFSGMQSQVTLISKSPADLTPQFLREHFGGMMIYDFIEWVKLHEKAFMKTRLPEFLILAPSLFKFDKPDPESYKFDGMRPDVSPWELTELGFVELFDIQFLRPDVFSIQMPE